MPTRRPYPIVDCHPHIYAANAGASKALGYPTVSDRPDARGISQPGGHSANAADPGADPTTPFEPAATADLKVRMDAHGVAKAVFIQTSSFYGFDNSYVMDSARDCAVRKTPCLEPFHAKNDRFTQDRLGTNIGKAEKRRRCSQAWAVGCCTLDPDNAEDLAELERAAASNCKGLRGLPDRDGRINSPNVKRLWSKAHELGMVVNLHCSVDHPVDEMEDIIRR
jgi:predicted TIM-barrel fold metal-dependent hydrolase